MTSVYFVLMFYVLVKFVQSYIDILLSTGVEPELKDKVSCSRRQHSAFGES